MSLESDAVGDSRTHKLAIAIHSDFLAWKRDLIVRLVESDVDQHVFDDEIAVKVLATPPKLRESTDILDYFYGDDKEQTLVDLLK